MHVWIKAAYINGMNNSRVEEKICVVTSEDLERPHQEQCKQVDDDFLDNWQAEIIC